jgi:hypothetical protein
MARSSEEATVAAAKKFLGIDVEASEETSGSETEEENETEETEDAVFPKFEIELPEDLLEELEEEDEFEVAAEELDDEDLEDLDPTVKKRLLEAEKKAKHFEQLRLKEGQKGWKAEAKEFFPFAAPFLDDINATSRRQFLKRAKDIHGKMAPLVEERVLKPARDAIEAEKAKARTEAREAAEIAWGKVPGSMNAPSDAVGTREKVERARGKKDLAGAIKAMAFGVKEE